MKIRSFPNCRRILASSLRCLAIAMLLIPTVASAQQSLLDRLFPIFDTQICGNVGDFTLNNATCLGGLGAPEQTEIAVQLSGNTAAAAGTNASQTTMVQVDSQTARLATVRSFALSASDSGIRSGSGDLGGKGRLGGFFNAFGGVGDASPNGEEPGFEYGGGGFTGGVDYLLNANVVVGGGFGWNRQTSDYDSNASVTGGSARVGGGDLVADSYVFSAFGSWFTGPFYVDSMISYTFVEYESERNIIAPAAIVAVSGQAKSDTDAHQVGITIGGGYQTQFHGFNVGPIIQFNYIHTMINSYKESGFALALAYENQKINSLVQSFGGEISYPVSTQFGVFTPHFRITWENELLDDPRKINARFILDNSGTDNTITTITPEPDRNYGRIGLGTAVQLRDGISAFFDYETIVGLRNIEAHKITAGGRFEF